MGAPTTPSPPPPHPSDDLPPRLPHDHHRTLQGVWGVLMGIGSLGLLESTIQASAAALQGVVASGVVSALPSPSLSAPV